MNEEEEKKSIRDMVAAGVLVGMVAAGAMHEDTNGTLAYNAFDLADRWMQEREKRNAR